MVDITILYSFFFLSKNKTIITVFTGETHFVSTTDSTYYIWLLHLDIKSEFWHPYIIMFAYIMIYTYTI